MTTHYLLTTPWATLVHEHEARGASPGPAVLFVPPFGWDDVASYRSRREWARRLADDGLPALRLDLPGTGDSAGAPGAESLVEPWIASVGAAAARLRATTGRRVVAVGFATGGLLAWAAAARGAAIDDLVLWGTPARGRAAVRELRAFAALKADEWGDGPPPAGAYEPQDAFDVTGFLVSDATAADLSALDLTALPLPHAAARRVAVLGRDGIPVDRRLREHLESSASDVRELSGDGWGAMTGNPQDTVVPDIVVAAIGGWLAEAPPTPVAASVDPPAVADVLRLGDVVERPWTAERSFGTQAGVLARPADGAPGTLGVVLLNGGAVRRTGPNRMWVEVARRWAARGVPVLRLDVEGLGDSDGDGQPYVDSARLYEPDLNEQVRQAIRELTAAGVARRWMAAGLCAGAAWAFHALVAGDEVDSAVLINPFAFYWEDELLAERDAGATRRLRSVDGWKRLAANGVSAERVGRVLRRAARTPFDRGRRGDVVRARVAREDADLSGVDAAGQHVTFLIGQGEPIYDRFEREGMLERLERWPTIELRRLPGRDHTFRAPWLQQAVHAEIDRAVDAARSRVAA